MDFLGKAVSWVVFFGISIWGTMFATHKYLTVKRDMDREKSSGS